MQTTGPAGGYDYGFSQLRTERPKRSPTRYLGGVPRKKAFASSIERSVSILTIEQIEQKRMYSIKTVKACLWAAEYLIQVHLIQVNENSVFRSLEACR